MQIQQIQAALRALVSAKEAENSKKLVKKNSCARVSATKSVKKEERFNSILAIWDEVRAERELHDSLYHSDSAQPRRPRFQTKSEINDFLVNKHGLFPLLPRYADIKPLYTDSGDYSFPCSATFPEILASDFFYSEFRVIRIYNCSVCSEKFKHNRNWTGSCPTCKAREMNEENKVGFVFAQQLGLSLFKMQKINTFSTSQLPRVVCSWECNQCGNTAVSQLRDMRFMTQWQASCPVCVRGPRYAALCRLRQHKQRRTASRLAESFGLRVLETNSPEPSLKELYSIESCGIVSERKVHVSFICLTCAGTGKRSLTELKQGRTCSCQQSSFGENSVMLYLKHRGISFIREYSLSRLGLGANLRFDFYLEDKKLAIEYDGEQHFKPITIFGGEEGFVKRKENDNLKNKLAANAGIRVLRIPFDCPDIGSFLDHNLISL